jgi:hypothetical protein
MLSGSRLAPTTATPLGKKKGWRLAMVETFSRHSKRSAAFSVRTISNSTSTSPPSRWALTWKPLSMKTESIFWFCARVKAWKRLTPRLAAMRASLSRSRVPRPLPW